MKRSRFIRVLRCDSKFRSIVAYAFVSIFIVSTLIVITFSIHLPNIEQILHQHLPKDHASIVYRLFSEILFKLISYISLFFLSSTLMAVVFAYRGVSRLKEEMGK